MLIHEVELIEKNDSVVLAYQRHAYFEDESVTFIKSNLKEGETFIDIGAYSGLYSILAAKKGCKVIGFEPVPDIYKRFLDNIKLNRVRVDARNLAVYDTVGLGTIYYSNGNILNSAASVVKDTRKHKRELIHTVNTIDNIPSRVCAIKIDVEGAEMKVLGQLVDLIKKDKPVMVVEALTDRDELEIGRFMDSINYTIRNADKNNLLCVPKA